MIRKNLKAISLSLILIKKIGNKFCTMWKMSENLPNIDILLDTHASLNKLSKKELKFLTKPWITGLQNSIKKKNDNYSKLVKCKDKS